MATFSNRRYVGLAAATVFLLALGCNRAARPATPVTGETRGTTSGGLPFTCIRVACNLNNLAASVEAGDRLVAMTGAGQLLSFDRATFRLESQLLDRRATCLGRGPDGTVLAAMADGDVVRVDPRTFALARIGHLDQTPEWLGAMAPSGSGPPHVLALIRDTALHEKGLVLECCPLAVADLTAGKTFGWGSVDEALVRYPGFGRVALADSRGRLWIGEDHGEWGGGACWFDLAEGAFHDVKSPFGEEGKDRDYRGNVYNFSELADGRILILGGCIHFDASTFIDEVRDGKAVPLYQEPGDQPLKVRMKGAAKRPESTTDRPRLPVTHILQDPKTGDLTVFAFSDVFQVGADFKSWKKTARLQIHYAPGRPDAMGAYPAVRAVHRTDDGFILATSGDGYATLSGDKRVPHAMAGQLQIDMVNLVAGTTEGVLVADADDVNGTWLVRDGKVARVHMAPPLDAAAEGGWLDVQVLLGPRGSLYSFSSTISDPVRRVVVRWRDGTAMVLSDQRMPGESWTEGKGEPPLGNAVRFVTDGKGEVRILASTAFVTPDGAVWRIGLGNKLQRLDEAARWVDAGNAPESGINSEPLRAVSDGGPPWIMAGRFGLWKMSVAAAGKALLEGLTVTNDEGADVIVWSAATMPGNRLLVAGYPGFWIVDLETMKGSRLDLKSPKADVHAVACDGLGRFWLVGSGVWMVEADERTVHRIDLGQTICGGYLKTVASDPAAPDAVFAAGSAGLVRIQVPQGSK
jgi:hypothetical protein